MEFSDEQSAGGGRGRAIGTAWMNSLSGSDAWAQPTRIGSVISAACSCLSRERLSRKYLLGVRRRARRQVPFDAAEAMRRLAAQGIGTRPFFWPMHEQPVLPQNGAIRRRNPPKFRAAGAARLLSSERARLD